VKRSTQLVVLGFTLAVVAGCARTPSPEPVDASADVAAIDAVREAEMAMINSGSADGVAEVYAANVAMMPPNEPTVNGMDALRTWWTELASQVTMTGRYTSSEVTVSGDWAFDRYTAELTATPRAGGESVTETIKGVHVLQRGADGSWRVVQDVWNSDAPPAGAAAPGGS
jgi:ketosteroid isomerase-like protein